MTGFEHLRVLVYLVGLVFWLSRKVPLGNVS